MSTWNYADVWEAVADACPSRRATTASSPHLGRVRPAGRQLGPMAPRRAASPTRTRWRIYLYNCPEYLESTFACFKLGLVPINTNYRYADDELVYLWENADAVAVIFHGVVLRADRGAPQPCARGPRPGCGSTTGPRAARRGRSPTRRRPRRTGHRSGAERRIRACAPGVAGPTTSTCSTPVGPPGMPKGVMWRQDDLFAGSTAAGFRHYPDDGGPDDVRDELAARRPGHDPAARLSAHARHRGVHRARVPERGRPGGDPRRPAASTRSSCSTPSSASRSTAWSSWATPSPSPSCAALDAAPGPLAISRSAASGSSPRG